MSSDAGVCPFEAARNSSSRSTSFSVAAITIISLLSAITFVLVIMLVSASNDKRTMLESPEPVSERRGNIRDSRTDIYQSDESWIHPAWLAASSSDSERSWQGQHPLVALIPPALSAMNTANARDKRLNLVRQSLLSSAQRVDWGAFDNHRSFKRQFAYKMRPKEKQKDESGWPLWV